jgi:hypothetical protein
MPDSILGLPSSKKFADAGDRFFNHRRKILHAYPNGKAPLTGILSMVPEEATNDSSFYWYERRYQSPVTTLRGTNPFTSDAPSTGDANDGTNAATAGAKGITTDFWLKVATTVDLKIGQVIRLDTTGAQFYVLTVTRGAADDTLLGHIKVRLVRGYTVAAASEFAAGTKARVISTAYGEGASGDQVRATSVKRPFAIMNTTQIFRDAFEFPGSVLKMGLKYDNEGPYKEKAKDTVMEHMTNLERALIFGQRSTADRAPLAGTQENLTVRTMSGIVEFLQLWDAGSTGLQIDGTTYAPYSFKGASTVDTDDQKRIIENASGTISIKKFNQWAERIGRYHTNKSNEKLVLCGSGALIALAEMFRLNTTMNVKMGDTAYGLDLMTLVTPFGKFHFVSHPLFNEDAVWTYWMLFLDIHALKYRPLTDRDTRLLKNRQNNGDDFRKDEYLTEAGLELWFPEHHMLVKNVQNYVES